jgi:hypothetical protein
MRKWQFIFNWVILWMLLLMTGCFIYVLYNLVDQCSVNKLLGEVYQQEVQDNKELQKLLDNYDNEKRKWENSNGKNKKR